MSLERILERLNIHELGLAQMRVVRTTEDFYQNLTKRYGIVPIEWLILSRIAKHSPEGIRVTDLARIFEVKSTYITSILNSLRTKSYIDTRFDPRDARVRLAVVTEAGNQQLSDIEKTARQLMLERLNGAISAQDFEHYTAVLTRLSRLGCHDNCAG